MRVRRASLGFAVVTVALSSCVPACKDKKSQGTVERKGRPALGEITIEPIPTVRFKDEDLHLDEQRLAAAVKRALEGTGTFATGTEAKASIDVRIEAMPFTEGSADDLEIGVRLRLRMLSKPAGVAPSRYEDNTLALGQAPLKTKDAEDAKDAFDRLVERTLVDLVRAYATRQGLWSNDKEEIARALASKDEDLRVEALRVVGEHRLRGFATTVLSLLDDEDENVRDAALGAAVRLKERRAVKVLADSRAMRDAREMRKILDAMASLGGTDARDYLEFVAENHDDDEIREMAEAAFERLSKGASNNRPTR